MAALNPPADEPDVNVPDADIFGPRAAHSGSCPFPLPGACPVACFSPRVCDAGTRCLPPAAVPDCCTGTLGAGELPAPVMKSASRTAPDRTDAADGTSRCCPPTPDGQASGNASASTPVPAATPRTRRPNRRSGPDHRP